MRNNAKWYNVVRVLVGIGFIFFGLMKFINPAAMKDAFAIYPSFFLPLIGACEIAGGIALLANKLVRWASLGLAVIMAGAVVTHFVIGDGPKFIPAAVLLALNVILLLKHPAATRV